MRVWRHVTECWWYLTATEVLFLLLYNTKWCHYNNRRERERSSCLPKRRDKASKTHYAAISKHLGHFCNTSDILLAVFMAEAKILVKSMTKVVAIQTVRWNALTHQVWFQCKWDGSLASSRQTWQSVQTYDTATYVNHKTTRFTVGLYLKSCNN